MNNTIIPVCSKVCDTCRHARNIDKSREMVKPHRDNIQQWLCIIEPPAREIYVLTKGVSTVPSRCPWIEQHEIQFFYGPGVISA